MRKSRFSEEQIAYALRQVESGTPATALCRKLGISEETFYRWKRAAGEAHRRQPGLEVLQPCRRALLDIAQRAALVRDAGGRHVFINALAWF